MVIVQMASAQLHFYSFVQFHSAQNRAIVNSSRIFSRNLLSLQPSQPLIIKCLKEENWLKNYSIIIVRVRPI